MRCRLRQNDTNLSDIYIGRRISISDIRYIFPTSVMLVLVLALVLALALALAPALTPVQVRSCISDVGYRYRTLDTSIIKSSATDLLISNEAICVIGALNDWA